MKIHRLHWPSALIGGIVVMLGFATLGSRPVWAGGSAGVSSPGDGPVLTYQLSISELTGGRYLLDTRSGRMWKHNDSAWESCASAPK